MGVREFLKSIEVENWLVQYEEDKVSKTLDAEAHDEESRLRDPILEHRYSNLTLRRFSDMCRTSADLRKEKQELKDLLTSIRYHCQVERIEAVGSVAIPCYKVAVRDELWERIRVALEVEG